ncbi:hypothetical protein E3V33_04160 [Candidatus Marinimicrobia bacterium MT.SAG.4]|nr:hypothetical protein E3V33_04160 [Candidatus Marinimicrobia bacterium MT.SAG.4]
MRTKNSNGLKVYLENVGILCAVHYPIPIPMQKTHISFGNRHGDFQTTEKLTEEILTLSLSPQLTEEPIEFVFVDDDSGVSFLYLLKEFAARESRINKLIQRIIFGIYYCLVKRFALPDMYIGGFDFVQIDRVISNIIVKVKE